MSRPLPDIFRFTRCAYDASSGVISLAYEFDGGQELVETIEFPHAPWPPEASRQAAFEQALRILHWVAGVSYYKAIVPPNIEVVGEANGLDHQIAGFLDQTYIHGLAEFAHLNGVDVAARVAFPDSAISNPTALSLVLPERALVAMGGGKDSLVGLHMLQQAGIEVLPITVGDSELIRDTVKAARLPLLQVRRRLAPGLAQMNAAGARNGHVPVTAINSCILLCAAILYGARFVVFANERSADEPTLITDDGVVVNHQYAKSSQFEAAFRSLIANRVSPDIEYFSIIRPFSEIEVVRRFSVLTDFHEIYSSCNRNFHLDGPRLQGASGSRWCRQCPKCLFAALSLALFLSPDECRAIQGDDLLQRQSNLDGIRALCGLGRDKPFECVGEIGESRAALAELTRRSAWRDHTIVTALAPQLEGLDYPPLGDLLSPQWRHHVPDRIAQKLGFDPAAAV